MVQVLLPIPPRQRGEPLVTWKDDERHFKRFVEAQSVNPAPVLPRVLHGQVPDGHGHRELSGPVSDGHPAPYHLLVLT